MRSPVLLLMVAAAGYGSAAAQTPSPASQPSTHERLAARLPSAAVAAVESLIIRSSEEGLPIEPMVSKALEGAAKGAAPDRIAAAVRLERAELRDAQLLIQHAGAAPPVSAQEITIVSHALRRGVPGSLIEGMIAASPDGSRGQALHAVADLMVAGIQPDEAYRLITAALRAGRRGERLFDVARAVTQEIERGRSPATAVARVRATLPPEPPRSPSRP
jgi:hypothetical protein